MRCCPRCVSPLAQVKLDALARLASRFLLSARASSDADGRGLSFMQQPM
jgi:hypothetical protein